MFLVMLLAGPALTCSLPARAGVCFKPMHWPEIGGTAPDVGFFEVHAENYMASGGPPHRMLEALRARWPLSLHGVGLSIGGEGPLDRDHLTRLRALIDRYEPASFSEHLAWSSHAGFYFNDLLPLPYTRTTLTQVARHVDQAQEALGRRLLLENPSTYVVLADTTIAETDFLAEVARRTGCGLLLDVNNVYVSAVNQGFDPVAYLDAFPLRSVGEIHLAGHAVEHGDRGTRLLIDAHDRAVDAAVWELYTQVVARIGPTPTLIEWDNDVPRFAVLMAEAAAASRVLARGERHPDAGVS